MAAGLGRDRREGRQEAHRQVVEEAAGVHPVRLLLLPLLAAAAVLRHFSVREEMPELRCLSCSIGWSTLRSRLRLTRNVASVVELMSS